MKRDPLDDLFSKLVRCRPNWTCERCGKVYNPNESRGLSGLHCSHLFGRVRKSVRWHPDNAVAHCYKCHWQLGERPREFSRWITEYLGSEKADELEARANRLSKWTKADKAQIRKEMKEQWLAMQEKRARGYEGRIEFSIPTVEDW